MGNLIKDLTGKKFGKLTIINRENNKNNKVYYLCKCDCGKEVIIGSYQLISGRTKSCGCYRKEKTKERQTRDLTGQRFGRLIALKKVNKPEKSKRVNSFWLCKCDCGNEKIINMQELTNGNTQSCGCKIHEPSHQLEDLTGQKFGRLIVINRAENSRNNRVRWLCKCDCGKETITASSNLKNGTVVSCGCYSRKIHSLPNGEAAKNDLLGSYKRNAKNRNLSFELSKEEFLELTKQNCFYCGKEPSTIRKNNSNNGDYIYNGIDRIDSSKGYTKENTVSCCSQCNMFKNKYLQSDFFEWIKTVHSNLTNKGLI
jgi:hypothetical protein